MAKIEKLKKGDKHIYPVTIGDAVAVNGKTLTKALSDLKSAIDNFEGGETYDDTEIRGIISGIQMALDTLTGKEDITAAIDSANEIFAFLESFENDSTLADVLNTMRTNIETWVNNQGYIKSGDIPSSLPANGGNADTVDGYHFVVGSSAGTAANTIYFVV